MVFEFQRLILETMFKKRHTVSFVPRRSEVDVPVWCPSLNCRRDRRLLPVSAAIVAIVSAFRNVSTKTDQAHVA